MKIYVKRNKFSYNGEDYSVEVLLRVEGKCDCLDRIEHRITNDEGNENSDDYNNVRVHTFLVQKHMETDIDYDYNDEMIRYDYEEEDLIPIHYCPICGDEMWVIVEETIDLTSKIKTLLDEHKKCETGRHSKAKEKRASDIRMEIRNMMFS